MKFLRCTYLLLLALLMTMSTSCSHEENTISDKLHAYVANDVDFIIAGNLKRVLEVTDSKTSSKGNVELSEYMQKLITTLPVEARNNINDMLDAEGFEWNSAVCGVRITSRGVQVLCVWSVTDEDDFVDYVKSRYGYKKSTKGSYTILSNAGSNLAIKDGNVFVVADSGKNPSADQTVSTVDEWQSNAKSKKIADWKVDFLDSDNVASALIDLNNVAKRMQDMVDEADFYQQTRPDVMMLTKMLPDARKVTIGFNFNIEGLTASIKGKFFTDNGKPYKLQHIDGSFNASLLKYLTNKDTAVMGVANASFITSMIGSSVTGFGSEIVNKWLDNFDGSVMIGTGLKNDNLKALSTSPIENMHFVMAADCKPGKAQQALASFARLIPFADGAQVTKNSGDELRFKMPTSYSENESLEPWEDGYYRPVYTEFIMKADGNVLLLSNEEIDSTPVADFTADMFKNKSVVAVAHFDKNGTIMRTINAQFGAELRYSLESTGGELTLSLNNTKKNLIEVLVDFAGPALNR